MLNCLKSGISFIRSIKQFLINDYSCMNVGPLNSPMYLEEPDSAELTSEYYSHEYYILLVFGVPQE